MVNEAGMKVTAHFVITSAALEMIRQRFAWKEIGVFVFPLSTTPGFSGLSW